MVAPRPADETEDEAAWRSEPHKRHIVDIVPRWWESRGVPRWWEGGGEVEAVRV
jgi:hypothetical protein